MSSSSLRCHIINDESEDREHLPFVFITSLFFFPSFFHVTHNITNPTSKYFNSILLKLQMLLMFRTLILQCSTLHSITIFFFIVYIIQFQKAINIQEEGSKIVAITSIMVKKFRGLITFRYLKSLRKFIFYTLYMLLLCLFFFSLYT